MRPKTRAASWPAGQKCQLPEAPRPFGHPHGTAWGTSESWVPWTGQIHLRLRATGSCVCPRALRPRLPEGLQWPMCILQRAQPQSLRLKRDCPDHTQ